MCNWDMSFTFLINKFQCNFEFDDMITIHVIQIMFRTLYCIELLSTANLFGIEQCNRSHRWHNKSQGKLTIKYALNDLWYIPFFIFQLGTVHKRQIDNQK